MALSQVFFATLIWIFLRVRRVEFVKANDPVPAKALTGLKWALGVTFLQMLLGAAIRHGGAGYLRTRLRVDDLLYRPYDLIENSLAYAAPRAGTRFTVFWVYDGRPAIGGTMPLLPTG